MKNLIVFFNSCFLIVFCSFTLSGQQQITLCSLIEEMVDMERLTYLPNVEYRSIQFSSYDRNSTSPNEEGWFANNDGFGREPIPNFEEVLKEPGENGIGEYLICDVQQPGAILRLWTARIRGDVRVFIDDMDTPVYEGNAEDFFWKTPEVLFNIDMPGDIFRQVDAVYFPIPFSSRLQIVWIGNIEETHFYHVGLRIYDDDVTVEPFSKEAINHCSGKLEAIINKLGSNEFWTVNNGHTRNYEHDLPASSTELIWETEEPGAIDHLYFRVNASDIDNVLRKSILNIYFDGSSIPQVQAPLGDFFGTAPGINPYHSLAFSVNEDGGMISRFVMPYKHSARIEIINHSGEDVTLNTRINTLDYLWEDGKTMHFRARWRIKHEVTTTRHDYPYLMAIGSGRIAGAATLLYNPTNIPTPGGGWWGEGDEKIFVDDDVFPSFFGTGTEDYYNYSWGYPYLFYYPYCGQPRNDGPGNRGYVINFRWHILDDIPFYNNIAFYMELLHHRVIPGFSYGSIVYYYAIPGTLDDHQQISMHDIQDFPYYPWKPFADSQARGYKFISAENIVIDNPDARVETGKLWAEEKILVWEPQKKGDKISFLLNLEEEIDETTLVFTMARMPDGGAVSLSINGNLVIMDDYYKTRDMSAEVISLYEDYHTVLDNFYTEKVNLKMGDNLISFEYMDDEPGKKIKFDFIWVKE